MSLVSTYVRAEDGELYANPIVYGEGWYLCFDDDDPPELVVKEGVELPELQCIRVDRPGHVSGRLFPPDWEELAHAVSYWCTLLAPIPVPTKHDGIFVQEKIWQGVIYDPLENQKGA